jgi:hypothetical protein
MTELPLRHFHTVLPLHWQYPVFTPRTSVFISSSNTQARFIYGFLPGRDLKASFPAMRLISLNFFKTLGQANALMQHLSGVGDAAFMKRIFLRISIDQCLVFSKHIHHAFNGEC